ncbi:MAG: hypothetical protein RIT28_1508 [Pseudomonadota bacterium]
MPHAPLTPLLLLLLLGCGEPRARGGGAAAGRPALTTLVLSDGELPSPFVCDGEGCAERALGGFVCDDQTPTAETVVVSGHSLPPMYLGGDAETLAAAIACVNPALVVLDTCYGFSTPLLQALASAGVRARVVGARRQVPGEGLRYGPAFFEAKDAEARAAAVRWGVERTESWVINAEELAVARQEVEAMSPEALTERLQRVHPNLVNVPLGDSGTTALVLVSPERFRRPSSPRRIEATPAGQP